ncbi:MAG: hypothetical protein ACREDH_10660 [Methylocella sp.]
MATKTAIPALVERAIAAAARAGAPAALFAHETKTSEAGLAQAAKALGLPLVFSRRPGFAASLFTCRHELAKSAGDVRTSFHRRVRRACPSGAFLCPASSRA